MPPLRLKRIARKLQAGEKCVVAIKEQKAVAYVFAAFAGTPSTKESQLELAPGEAYIWAGYALPSFRRQGVVRGVHRGVHRGVPRGPSWGVNPGG